MIGHNILHSKLLQKLFIYVKMMKSKQKAGMAILSRLHKIQLPKIYLGIRVFLPMLIYIYI